jgi:hypothetical protein
MSSLDLHHLERTILDVKGSRGLAVINVSRQPAFVFVDVRCGTAWHGWRCLDGLEPGVRWWTDRAEAWGDAVRVVACGADNGQPIVRVEY